MSNEEWYVGYAIGGPVEGCILRSRSPFYRVIPKGSTRPPHHKYTPLTGKIETVTYHYDNGYWRVVT